MKCKRDLSSLQEVCLIVKIALAVVDVKQKHFKIFNTVRDEIVLESYYLFMETNACKKSHFLY